MTPSQKSQSWLQRVSSKLWSRGREDNSAPLRFDRPGPARILTTQEQSQIRDMKSPVEAVGFFLGTDLAELTQDYNRSRHPWHSVPVDKLINVSRVTGVPDRMGFYFMSIQGVAHPVVSIHHGICMHLSSATQHGISPRRDGSHPKYLRCEVSPEKLKRAEFFKPERLPQSVNSKKDLLTLEPGENVNAAHLLLAFQGRDTSVEPELLVFELLKGDPTEFPTPQDLGASVETPKKSITFIKCTPQSAFAESLERHALDVPEIWEPHILPAHLRAEGTRQSAPVDVSPEKYKVEPRIPQLSEKEVLAFKTSNGIPKKDGKPSEASAFDFRGERLVVWKIDRTEALDGTIVESAVVSEANGKPSLALHDLPGSKAIDKLGGWFRYEVALPPRKDTKSDGHST